jgi:hypothetical protein
MMGIFKKTIDSQIEKWTDEEVLFNFSKFFDRVGISTKFVQDEDGLLTHQVLTMICGEKAIMSEPQKLEWPLQPLPMPEAFEGKIH